MAEKIVKDKDFDFAEFITDLVHGQLNQKLGQKLVELVSAVEETGKSGTLMLKLTVKREGQMATVSADVKCTRPEHATPATMFFFGKNGELMREDPRQLRLKEIAPERPMKSVPAAPTPIRTAPAPAPAVQSDETPEGGNE